MKMKNLGGWTCTKPRTKPQTKLNPDRFGMEREDDKDLRDRRQKKRKDNKETVASWSEKRNQKRRTNWKDSRMAQASGKENRQEFRNKVMERDLVVHRFKTPPHTDICGGQVFYGTTAVAETAKMDKKIIQYATETSEKIFMLTSG